MLLDLNDYEVGPEVGTWDYEWMIGAILTRKSDGAMFFAVDGGCSCYGYGDNLTPDDLKPIKSWHEAVELAKETFTDAEVFEFANSLANPKGDTPK